MHYPVKQEIYQECSNFVEHVHNRNQRRQLNAALSAINNKSFFSIWIDSAQTYLNINDELDKAPVGQDIIIYQVEEDWFNLCDYTTIRNRIKNHQRWTDNSFVVTNSIQDKNKTLDLKIKSVCRPGILDLLTYRPYDLNIITGYNDIEYHTGVCWERSTPGRFKIIQLFTQYREKIIVAKLGRQIINNIKSNNLQHFAKISDAPFQRIDTDFNWYRHTAFGTVIETYYSEPFSPTLSEKTYRNMHLCRPALIFGGQGTREYLISLGFDTWDWIIDWSFDSEPDKIVRFSKYLNELERLLNLPIQILVDLIVKNQDKLLYNRNRLFWLINNYDSIDI
jgi:hypothetical protein